MQAVIRGFLAAKFFHSPGWARSMTLCFHGLTEGTAALAQ